VNLLFISRCWPTPLISGDRVLLYHLARELRARGHTLDLIAFHLADEETPADGPEGPFAAAQAILEKPRSSLDYLLRMPHLFPDSLRQCWNPAMWEAIERRLTGRPYDLVHFFGGVQVYEFRNLVAPRVPTIIVPYESYSLALERAMARAPRFHGRLRLWGRRMIARRYEAAIYRGFGKVVLVTGSDQAHLRRHAVGLPTVVIPNGVSSEFFRPLPDGFETPSLAFVGNFAYPPNVEAALTLIRDVLPRVQSEVPETRAVLIGVHPPRALTSLAASDVEVTGAVADIRPHVKRSACFVSALVSGSGIRNKILEAMAMGIPVAATSLSCEGIHATAEENVLLGETPQALADAALRLLRDGSLWRRIAQGAQRLMRREHTWEGVAAQYEELYRSVIDETARSMGRQARQEVGSHV
jgi:glycosyltransferase involved in cell wall biosynthesis